MDNETVLVTGGTGFLAGHCVLRLARDGYRVRFTVRSVDAAVAAQRSLAAAGAPTESMTFAVADLTADANWAEAVEGCDYVLHVASPSPSPRGPGRSPELMTAPRDGALRVLRAARDAGVRRTVLTSSFAAIGYGHPKSTTRAFTERDWTYAESLGIAPYVRSRTLAERAAWAYIEQQGDGMELAVVNPVGIFGPVLGPRLAGSVAIIKAMLDGDLPRTPRLWTSVVDVRDVADLHVRAMTSPKAAGERFLAAAGDAISFHHIAQTLRDRLGADASRVPDRDMSSAYVRALAPFAPPLRQFRRNLDVIRHTDAAKARAVLDWDPRPPEEAIIATARSLLDLGLTARLFRPFRDQRVGAGFVMHLPAGHRRVEHAHGADVGLRPDGVVVVVVEQVQAARRQRVDLARVVVGDRALALDDEDRLDVVGIPELVLGTRVQDRLVDREPRILLGQHDPAAAPSRGLDIPVVVRALVERANYHPAPSVLRIKSGKKLARGADGLGQDVQPGVEVVLAGGERRHELGDLGVGARGLDQQSVAEGGRAHRLGE